jgi:hypothetical protein
LLLLRRAKPLVSLDLLLRLFVIVNFLGAALLACYSFEPKFLLTLILFEFYIVFMSFFCLLPYFESPLEYRFSLLVFVSTTPANLRPFWRPICSLANSRDDFVCYKSFPQALPFLDKAVDFFSGISFDLHPN